MDDRKGLETSWKKLAAWAAINLHDFLHKQSWSIFRNGTIWSICWIGDIHFFFASFLASEKKGLFSNWSSAVNAQNVPEICYHCENGRRVVVTESYEELQPFDSNASRDTNGKKVPPIQHVSSLANINSFIDLRQI